LDVKGFSEQIEIEDLQQAEPLHPAMLRTGTATAVK
jgi:hypothetical protein